MKTIAAQPFDFTFEPAHTALIVIDMQRDFIEPGGFGETLGNDVSLLERIVPTVGRLIEAFRIAKLPIIHTRECHKPDLSDLPAGQATARQAVDAHRRSGPDGPHPDRRRARRRHRASARRQAGRDRLGQAG